MCPLWSFHYIIICILILITLLMVKSTSSITSGLDTFWNVTFSSNKIFGLKINEVKTVNFSTSDFTDSEYTNGIITIVPTDDTLLSVYPSKINMDHNSQRSLESSFRIEGKFLGYTDIKMKIQSKDSISEEVITRESSVIPISVVRQDRLIDKLFTISVAVLVSIIFVNFGCALNEVAVKECIKRPMAPFIGTITQLIFMPLISYALARILFEDSVSMQLGLFFTGISPSGGASNVWTCMLNGNINLSIALTALSTIASFGTMPLWTFTLGRHIFTSGALAVPYSRIASTAAALVFPLLIGFTIQKKFPNASKLMVRILKPFSAFLILFIVVFATVANFFLFKLFTWKILLGGLALPCLGFLIAGFIALIFNQPRENVIALAVETSIQNTGISIFMLRFSLGQPEADLTSVMPVAVSLMTPIPLLLLSLMQRLSSRNDRKYPQSSNSLIGTNKIEEITNIDIRHM